MMSTLMIVEHYCERMHGNQKYIRMLGGLVREKSGNTIVCVVRRDSVLQQELLEAGIPIVAYDRGLKGLFEVAEAFRTVRPDHVLANNERSLLKAFIGKSVARSNARLMWFVKNARRNFVVDLVAGFVADRVLFISRLLLERKGMLFNRLFSVKSSYVPILVEVSELSEVSEPAMDGLRILMLSSITPMKGVGVLVDALEQLDRRRDVDLSVRILGATPSGMEVFRAEVEARAQQLSSVKLTIEDWSRDIAALMADCNLFVLPSFLEGVPRSITEAMQAGRAVIATRVGGVPDVVEHGENGVVVDAGDAEALASAIESYVDNPELLLKHGNKSREMYRRKFDNDYHLRALFNEEAEAV